MMIDDKLSNRKLPNREKKSWFIYDRLLLLNRKSFSCWRFVRKPRDFQPKHHFGCWDLQFLQHLWVQQPHRSTDWDVYGIIMNLLCPSLDVRWRSLKLLLTKSTAKPQLNSKFTHLVFITSQGTVSLKTYDNNKTLILPETAAVF